MIYMTIVYILFNVYTICIYQVMESLTVTYQTLLVYYLFTNLKLLTRCY